jgi:uncharacterized protein with HEPN domain
MDKDKIYLEEIREFCGKVIGFIADISYDEFLKDEKLQLAIVKLIENIGEAASRLSQETQEDHPSVDWNKAKAMRNRLVHEYMSVDLGIVYDVAVNEVPKLLKSLNN